MPGKGPYLTIFLLKAPTVKLREVLLAVLVTTETSPVRGDEALPGLGLRGLGQVAAGVGGVGGGPGHEQRVA